MFYYTALHVSSTVPMFVSPVVSVFVVPLLVQLKLPLKLGNLNGPMVKITVRTSHFVRHVNAIFIISPNKAELAPIRITGYCAKEQCKSDGCSSQFS